MTFYRILNFYIKEKKTKVDLDGVNPKLGSDETTLT